MSASANFISKLRRRAIYRRDGFACVWCLRSLVSEQHLLTLDHVVPRAHGGTHRTSNLVTACLGCNSARGCKSLLMFAHETARAFSIGQISTDTAAIIMRVLVAAETPILTRLAKRHVPRGQVSMVLQEGVLR